MALWDGLEEFLMVVETGGFTAAARRLGVSASHVSRQVARLEDRLGVKLLARSTRVVRLTDAGRDYHARVAGLVAGLEEANQSAAGDRAQIAGRIRVSAAGPFAEQFVAPALARFASLHPNLSVTIDFNSRLLNLTEEGFDFAIRYGQLTESGLIARRLATRRMVCVAARGYLDRHGRPTHPADLRHHQCLITNNDRWVFRDPGSGDPIEIRVHGRWQANNPHAVLSAARQGLGVMYAPEIFLGAKRPPELEPILQGYEDPSRASWIVYPERRHLPLRVRRAMDFLVEELGDAVPD
ncbi:LysR family transcriptional regulator [Ruegeria arenilitoris]|uniref:HTH-type transcriptional regulator DmlR n=1 Tax=Ruegeria arenilitoris TaxID=1173585 RepID=A0A238KT98_9RHOB|nr:LysR family transcriptional regulator [Ruegeria arenilitoris]SMX45256.1 HTH-type transcriptional regulator DmlR [Ruegeria arenilitoris]